METLIIKFLEMFEYSYVGSIILLTHIILNRGVKNPSNWIKSLTTVIVGIVLALVWYYLIEFKELNVLIYSFLFANAFYSLLLKNVLKAMGTNYNNDKGVI